MENKSKNYELVNKIHEEGRPLSIKPLYKTISDRLAENRKKKSTNNNRETGNAGKSRRRRKRRRRIKKSEKRKK